MALLKLKRFTTNSHLPTRGHTSWWGTNGRLLAWWPSGHGTTPWT